MPSMSKAQQKNYDKLRNAQQRPIKHLVFSGGGAKGVVYPGAYRAMKESGVLDEVVDVAGSSAGAITAALIAVGTSIEDIRNISLNTPMNSLLGNRLYKSDKGVIPLLSKDGAKLQSLIRDQIKKTILDSDLAKLEDENEIKKLLPQLANTKVKQQALVNRIKLLVEKIKSKNIELTFLDLHILHQFYPHRFKNLVVTAVQLSGQAQRFDYKETPDISIALACRASSSIPVMLKPVEITIDGKTASYVDGGIENNLPTNLISDMKHPEDSLVFAFGEGEKAGVHFRTDRVANAMHRSHWSELIDDEFIANLFKKAIAGAKKRKKGAPNSHLEQALAELLNKNNADAFTKELKIHLNAAVNEVYKQAPDDIFNFKILTSALRKQIKQIPRSIYEPHLLERVGQNWAPGFLINFNPSYLSTDKKYEDYRRIRDEYPLRTVDLHVGPVSTIDFDKASKLARLMDAVGYADTMNHILAHELGTASHLPTYHSDKNQHFATIYRALLVSTGADPRQDKLLKEWQALTDSLVSKSEGESQAIQNNFFEKLKTYALSHPSSLAAFSFTRALEYHDGLIDEDCLLKETYLEAFRRKSFARSQFSGKTFFFASSLEKALKDNPELMPSLSKAAAELPTNTRMNTIAHILKTLSPPHKEEVKSQYAIT